MKRIFILIKDELIFGGQIISLGAVSVVATFSLAVGLPVSKLFLLITYLGIYAVYAVDHLKDLELDDTTNHERVHYIRRHKKAILDVIILFFALSMIILAFKKGIHLALAGGSLFVAGFAYTFIFKKLTKRIIGFKNVYVAISYTFLLVLYMLYKGLDFNPAVVYLLFFVFMRFLAAEAFYDLKDKAEDKENGLMTFALSLNSRDFNIFLLSINTLSVVPLMLSIYYGHLTHSLLPLSLVVLYYDWVIIKARKCSNKAVFSYIFCDGERLLWLPLLILGYWLS